MAPLDEIRAAFLRKPWKRVVNSSGETIPPFAVLRVISSSNSNGELLVSVGKPNTTFLSEYLVNGPWAIGSGSSNEGLATDLSESNYVLYGSGSPAVGQEWGPTPSQWYLTRYRYGFKVKGSTYSFGAYTALVAKQSEVVNFIGKAYGGDITSGSTGTLAIYDGNEVDTTLTLTGKNRTGVTFSENTWGLGIWTGGTVFLEPWECPA